MKPLGQMGRSELLEEIQQLRARMAEIEAAWRRQGTGMNHHYRDIRSRITEEPTWFDEAAVPRYCAFSPMETANIYATEVALLLIACQACGREFRVCMTSSAMDVVLERGLVSELIQSGQLHYGDPPNVECCPAGPTMNSVPRQVLEFWRLGKGHAYERDPALEVALKPDWLRDD